MNVYLEHTHENKIVKKERMLENMSMCPKMKKEVKMCFIDISENTFNKLLKSTTKARSDTYGQVEIAIL